jgi:hypothetical protein
LTFKGFEARSRGTEHTEQNDMWGNDCTVVV